MIARSFWTCVLAFGTCALGQAQHLPGPAQQGPAPLLFVRFAGAPGSQVTAYQGDPAGQMFQAPAVFGLRPGYIHRFRLSGIPGFESAELYPSLEVAGTLHLPSQQRASEFPAPITFSQDDILRAIAGTMVTKVVYLEHPELALPIRVTLDQPFEREARFGVDPLEEARFYGRPMVIVRLGGRQLSPRELASSTVPGTVLAPGKNSLAPPATPPYLPFRCWQPQLDECLTDGGDRGLKADIDGEGKLRNVEPADTVAQYKDVTGQQHTTPSNQVCICVPRFGVVKVALPLAGLGVSTTLSGTKAVQDLLVERMRTPPVIAEQIDVPEKMKGRLRASTNISQQNPSGLIRIHVLDAVDIPIGAEKVIGTTGLVKLEQPLLALLIKKVDLAKQLSRGISAAGVDQTEFASVIGKVQGTNEITRAQSAREVALCCKDKIEAPAGPLVLCKWVDKHDVQIGDVVTFYLKYTNVGGQPITDVAVTDSLMARLEYIPGSAKSDRQSVFTMQENEVGSLKLRWEIGDKVLPAEGGIVSFQARIR